MPPALAQLRCSEGSGGHGRVLQGQIVCRNFDFVSSWFVRVFFPLPLFELLKISCRFKNVILFKQLTQNTWSGGVS